MDFCFLGQSTALTPKAQQVAGTGLVSETWSCWHLILGSAPGGKVAAVEVTNNLLIPYSRVKSMKQHLCSFVCQFPFLPQIRFLIT